MTLDDLLSGRRWVVLEHDSTTLYEAIDDKSVDHVITDPPYEEEAHTKQRRVLVGRGEAKKRGLTVGQGKRSRSAGAPVPADTSYVRARDTKWGADGRAAIGNVEISFPPITTAEREKCGAEWGRITRRWCIAFCQIEAVAEWRRVMRVGGLVWKRAGIWVKPDAMPQITGDRPGTGFESIAMSHAKGRSRWNGGGRSGVFTHLKGRYHVHPTEKPISLMMELIELFTDPGDVVLDPYCGSATTGVACLRLGRRFVGIEGHPPFAAMSRERLSAEEQGITLQDARRSQLALFGGGQACG